MSETLGVDPFFEYRLKQGKAHRVLQRFDSTYFKAKESSEVKENKSLTNPSLEGAIADFGWSARSVENIMSAHEAGWISIEPLGNERIRIEFLPIQDLPEQLGHVTELSNLQRNLEKNDGVFGVNEKDQITYLQTVDFAVEGYMDDEREGKRYARVFVDSTKLAGLRNVYLDPESLHVTDYEYGHAFAVFEGIPFSVIDHVDIILAKPVPFEISDYEEWSDMDPEQEMKESAQKLTNFIDSL